MARRRKNPAQGELFGEPLAHGSSMNHGGLVRVEVEQAGAGVQLVGTPAPGEGREPWYKRMGYKHDPNLAPIVGYAFSDSDVVACLACFRKRSKSSPHPDFAGLGCSIPLLRLSRPAEPRLCKWCGGEVRGQSGYRDWLKGKLR